MELSLPLTIAILAGFASILFLLGTAFVKLSIVFLILRNALGLQQAPSNNILFALAIILAMFISMPVITDTFSILRDEQPNITTIDDLFVVMQQAHLPLRGFMQNNVGNSELSMVSAVAAEQWKGTGIAADQNHFMILMTSFVISELTRAFEIGFLLFLPFVAIDLIVTIILMALGMMMVSPTIISIPFKLLLFVAVGGWAKLFTGLTMSYAVV